MQRDVVRERHLLHILGGAWAFRSDLIDKHPEVTRFEIVDDEGTEYRADRETLNRYALRRDLGVGEQLILALRYWRTILPGGEIIEHTPGTSVIREIARPRVEQLPLAL